MIALRDKVVGSENSRFVLPFSPLAGVKLRTSNSSPNRAEGEHRIAMRKFDSPQRYTIFEKEKGEQSLKAVILINKHLHLLSVRWTNIKVSYSFTSFKVKNARSSSYRNKKKKEITSQKMMKEMRQEILVNGYHLPFMTHFPLFGSWYNIKTKLYATCSFE